MSEEGVFYTTKNAPNDIRLSNFKEIKQWHTETSLEFWPTKEKSVEKIAEGIFRNSGPETPIFTDASKILTLGSCFAERLRTWLKANQKISETLHVPEGLNNSFAVRQYIEWALTGDVSSDAYWYDQNESKGIHKWKSEEDQSIVKQKFQEQDAFIITFGLSEVWRDKKTKGVFWRGIPSKEYNSRIHECVITTVEENYSNMTRIIELIREHCGEDVPVIFSLSPVPLNGTFLGRSCVISDCVSKSILRVAMEEVNKQNFKNWYYWPSFEFAKWVPAHLPVSAFGGDPKPLKPHLTTDSRHVSEWVVGLIIDNFVKKFFKEKK